MALLSSDVSPMAECGDPSGELITSAGKRRGEESVKEKWSPNQLRGGRRKIGFNNC